MGLIQDHTDCPLVCLFNEMYCVDMRKNTSKTNVNTATLLPLNVHSAISAHLNALVIT